MNTFLANRTATPNNQTLNSLVLASLSTQRYRNREFGIGYGRSQGYARSHSLWSTSAKRSRYC
ncbi:hypothetical protein [Alkalisalibacterium limincola]|uniref:Uncharacterized protein n=1 Tax=Alkalisalibacterium limincola TaxID=2699169 RepID=A0A5C8KSP0_9GAMM|nr:hypothetical protein [Alkalisalibacterium limincola]TXK62352.1 hypothetical protein FU658_08980 [Alkalisalibacterium limincola]